MGVTLTPFISDVDMPNILGTASGRIAFSNFLGDLAARYGHLRSDLLSFEILNEPHSITGSVSSDCAFPACSPPIWRDLQWGFVSAIRKSAPGHTVIVSAADWNNPPALLRFVPYDDPNLIYAFHYYPAQVFVAQSAWLPEHGLRYPSCLPGNSRVASAIQDSRQAAEARQYIEGGWSRERMADELAQVADWAARNGVRVFANEMGAFPLELESRTRWVRDQRLALEQLQFPWTVWSVFDYYTRGWVHGDRLPVPELLRGVGGMAWMYPDPSCGAQASARVDLSATIEPGRTEFRVVVGNAGPDTAKRVEARIGMLAHQVIGAVPDQGSCLVTRWHVDCRLGDLPSGASVQIRVTTDAADHADSPAQVFVVSDDRELDDADNHAVHALPDLDGDGIFDRLDPDRDGDGLADWFEAEWGTDRSDPRDQLLDSDRDGYSNLAEARARSRAMPFGSNPFDASSTPPQPGGGLSASVGPVERVSSSPARWAVRSACGTWRHRRPELLGGSAPSPSLRVQLPSDRRRHGRRRRPAVPGAQRSRRRHPGFPRVGRWRGAGLPGLGAASLRMPGRTGDRGGGQGLHCRSRFRAAASIVAGAVRALGIAVVSNGAAPAAFTPSPAHPPSGTR